MSLRVIASLAVASLALTACAIPADLEPEGTTVAEPVPTETTKAAVLWVYYPAEDSSGRMPAESVVVTGAYPGGFSLAIDEPPPEDALRGSKTLIGHDPSNEARLGYGIIVALNPGADLEDVQLGDIAGCDSEHVVVYAESALQPGSYGAALMNAPLAQGFHMMRATWTDMTDEWDCYDDECWSLVFFPAERGFGEQLHITPGISKLPLW